MSVENNSAFLKGVNSLYEQMESKSLKELKKTLSNLNGYNIRKLNPEELTLLKNAIIEISNKILNNDRKINNVSKHILVFVNRKGAELLAIQKKTNKIFRKIFPTSKPQLLSSFQDLSEKLERLDDLQERLTRGPEMPLFKELKKELSTITSEINNLKKNLSSKDKEKLDNFIAGKTKRILESFNSKREELKTSLLRLKDSFDQQKNHASKREPVDLPAIRAMITRIKVILNQLNLPKKDQEKILNDFSENTLTVHYASVEINKRTAPQKEKVPTKEAVIYAEVNFFDRAKFNKETKPILEELKKLIFLFNPKNLDKTKLNEQKISQLNLLEERIKKLREIISLSNNQINKKEEEKALEKLHNLYKTLIENNCSDGPIYAILRGPRKRELNSPLAPPSRSLPKTSGDYSSLSGESDTYYETQSEPNNT